jgi:heme/copper-type cytochrome/quinol oxidase subunit 3
MAVPAIPTSSGYGTPPTPNTFVPPPSTTSRAGTPALVGTICAIVGGAMLTTGVCSAYLSVRNASGADFVPVTMPFNNYAAVMTLITLSLASVAIGWGTTSMKLSHRRWASTGFGLSAFLDLAALNMLWFIAQDAKLPAAGEGPYGVLFYALIIVAVVVVAIGLISSLTALARVLGGQATARQPHYARHALWLQHFALASYFAIYATIFWLK